MEWNALLSRATELGTRCRRRAAASRLLFFRALTRFQMDIYHRAKAGGPADVRRLDTRFLASFFPDFLLLVERYGPAELAAQAQRAQDRQDWEEILRACWQQSRERMELFARAILQPYVCYLSERWRDEVGILGDEGGGRCPFCGRPPLLAVTNGHRQFVCSLCSGGWPAAAGACPACAGRQIDIFRHRAMPHVRAEGCRVCRRYLKVIDVGKEPAAVPVVDEMAALELDDLARRRGLTKFEPNLAGN